MYTHTHTHICIWKILASLKSEAKNNIERFKSDKPIIRTQMPTMASFIKMNHFNNIYKLC